MDLKTEILDISNDIGFFIKNWIQNNDGFGNRTFYGETFSLAFLNKIDILDTSIKKKLISSYENMDKSDSDFHWEFNNYALLEYYDDSGDEKAKKNLNPLKFKNTQCTNWTLLRSNARLAAGKNIELALKEAKNKINNYQLDSGFILDEKKVKSFQYHCFSTAMVAELFIKSEKKEFLESFLSGVDFIRNFIMENGDTLYIGRGQKQSFGYGIIIYILTLAYKYTSDNTILGDIKRIMTFLKEHQKKDGSFPLVLNKLKEDISENVDMGNSNYAGWYPYNNYFDYLSFMGFFLIKSYNIIKKLNTKKITYKKNQSYCDDNFMKISNKKYEAVVSKTGGYWTNDMPIPYLVSKKKTCTPCYGGEQFQKSLYNLKGIPLPYCRFFNKSIRWRSYSFFKENVLWILSPLGIMKRVFIFKERSIKVMTNVYSVFNFVNLYLFLEETKYKKNKLQINNVEIISKNPLIYKGHEYSADGKLKLFEDQNQNSSIEFIIKD